MSTALTKAEIKGMTLDELSEKTGSNPVYKMIMQRVDRAHKLKDSGKLKPALEERFNTYFSPAVSYFWTLPDKQMAICLASMDSILDEAESGNHRTYRPKNNSKRRRNDK